MAHSLESLFPKILASALVTLRENCVFPNLVNEDYSAQAAQKGDIIHVPIPSKMVAVDVVPSAVPQETPDLDLQTVQIPLNQWKEVGFTLDDKQVMQIQDGVPSMQVVEAARALANVVNGSLLSLYKTPLTLSELLAQPRLQLTSVQPPKPGKSSTTTFALPMTVA